MSEYGRAFLHQLRLQLAFVQMFIQRNLGRVRVEVVRCCSGIVKYVSIVLYNFEITGCYRSHKIMQLFNLSFFISTTNQPFLVSAARDYIFSISLPMTDLVV